MVIKKGVFVGLTNDGEVYICDMTEVGIKSMNEVDKKDNPIYDHWEDSGYVNRSELVKKLDKEYFTG